jgi:hypothetical protein
MASAAGGTSHRLNCAPAMVRCLSNNPDIVHPLLVVAGQAKPIFLCFIASIRMAIRFQIRLLQRFRALDQNSDSWRLSPKGADSIRLDK